MFVPGLAMLPFAPSVGSGVDVSLLMLCLFILSNMMTDMMNGNCYVVPKWINQCSQLIISTYLLMS